MADAARLVAAREALARDNAAADGAAADLAAVAAAALAADAALAPLRAVSASLTGVRLRALAEAAAGCCDAEGAALEKR